MIGLSANSIPTDRTIAPKFIRSATLSKMLIVIMPDIKATKSADIFSIERSIPPDNAL